MKCSLHPIEVAQVLTLYRNMNANTTQMENIFYFIESMWGEMLNKKRSVAFTGEYTCAVTSSQHMHSM